MSQGVDSSRLFEGLRLPTLEGPGPPTVPPLRAPRSPRRRVIRASGIATGSPRYLPAGGPPPRPRAAGHRRAVALAYPFAPDAVADHAALIVLLHRREVGHERV